MYCVIRCKSGQCASGIIFHVHCNHEAFTFVFVVSFLFEVFVQPGYFGVYPIHRLTDSQSSRSFRENPKGPKSMVRIITLRYMKGSFFFNRPGCSKTRAILSLPSDRFYVFCFLKKLIIPKSAGSVLDFCQLYSQYVKGR